MTDLDRLLHWYYDLHASDGAYSGSEEDFESLKAKIQGQIHKSLECPELHKYDESKIKELESKLEYTSDKLGNELQVKYLETEQLESILDEIKTAWKSETHPMSAYNAVNKILAKHEDKKCHGCSRDSISVNCPIHGVKK